MTLNEQSSFQILWYLNEYPDEVNATDDIIRNALKMTLYDFNIGKEYLLERNYIYYRNDNQNNIAYTITLDGITELKHLNDLRLSELENRQGRIERNVFYVNLTIAIGTSVAAIYYLIEIIKNFSCCH